MTKFSDHVVTFRSSPTVFADTPVPTSASTRILAGKPLRAMSSAAVFLHLYRGVWSSLIALSGHYRAAWCSRAAPRWTSRVKLRAGSGRNLWPAYVFFWRSPPCVRPESTVGVPETPPVAPRAGRGSRLREPLNLP